MVYQVTELRSWDLDEASTRYEHSVALPSESTVFVGLTVYAAIALAVSVVLLIQILSILTTARVRDKAFNLYLLFLVIPDFVFSFLCGLTCALNAAAGGHYTSHWMCEFQSFYTIFGFAGSAWMNAVIARELHTMIRYSHGRRRYRPPTATQVCLQAAVVYAWSAFVGSWTLMDGFLPHRAVPYRGTACLPAQPTDVGSGLFFWLVFVPAMMVVPFAYVMYVWWDVYYHKLLPLTGRTRMIFVYFLHLVIVYLVMWMPTALFMFVVIKFGYWASWTAGTWSHLQGFVSVAVSLHKPDIRHAFVGFVTCSSRTPPSQWGTDNKRRVEHSTGSGGYGTGWSHHHRSATMGTGWSRIFRSSSLFRKSARQNPSGGSPIQPVTPEEQRQQDDHPAVLPTPRPNHPSSTLDSRFSQEPQDEDLSDSPWDAEDVHDESQQRGQDNAHLPPLPEGYPENPTTATSWKQEESEDDIELGPQPSREDNHISDSQRKMQAFRGELQEQLSQDDDIN